MEWIARVDYGGEWVWKGRRGSGKLLDCID